MYHQLRPASRLRPVITAAILAACAYPALAGTVIWNVNASGLWTTPNNWSSNPALPGPADDVLINQSNPITVTLSSGVQTVNSLTDDNTLSLNSGGNLTVASDLQVNGAFQLNGGTLQNTTLSVAPSAIVNFTSGTLANDTLSGNITQTSGTVILSGTITNNANWIQTSSASLSISNTTTLNGNGTITFSNAIVQSISASPTLNIGPNQTLQGSMNAPESQLLINNSGTVNANLANGSISIFYLSATALNNGTLKSTNGGSLFLNGTVNSFLNNAGGIISAASLGNVTIAGLTLSGGQLSTDATGQISFQTGSLLLDASASGNLVFSGVTLANDTLSGNITQTASVSLTGTVTNNANWTQTISSGLSANNTTTLDGNGTITLLHATVQNVSGSATLNIGPNQTLQGSMVAPSSQLLINNSGTINANVANTTISIFYHSVTALNNGTLESTNGGTLSLNASGSGYLLNNAGGIISATSLGNVTITGLTISGGQLSTDASGQISFQSGAILTGASVSGNLFFSSVALANDTLSGNITQTGCVTLTGTVTNNANWIQTGSGNSLNVSNITTLDGNGTITLLHANVQTLSGNATLNIGPNQTLQGSMNVPQSQLLINNSGTINPNVANATISIFYPSTTAFNNGTLKSTNGGTLILNGGGSNCTLNNTGGLISATSLGNVTVNALNVSGGQLSTDATGQISFQTGAVLTGASASGNLIFTSATLANDTLSGNITQPLGIVTLSGTVTNNANWTQTGSTNSLNISNTTTLDGNGTITLSHASVQSPSGNATLNIGPNQTLQGSMSVSPSLLQFNNSGTINANVANATINISYPSATALNNGTLESTNGGSLSLNNGSSNSSLNNTGGLISATGSSNGAASKVTVMNGLTISGGQLSTDAIGQILFQSAVLTGASVSGNLVFSSITLANDTLSGIITQTALVALSGTVTNNANWTEASSGSSLLISNMTTLDGNGTITLSHALLQTLSGSATLNIGPNQTLQGSLTLSPQLRINNSGTINVNQFATTLNFSGPFLTNTGLIEATNGASLSCNGYFTNAGTLVIGPNSALISNPLLMQSGTLAGSGAVNGAVVAGSLPHTIHPGMPGTTLPGSLTLSALSTSSATTLAFNLAAPETPSTPSSNDQLVIFAAGGLSLNGGAIAITSAPGGPASLGYYSVIQYTTSFTGSLAALSLPVSTTPNIVYTLDTTHDPGFIDLHIGLLGDANDDGAVDLTDLSTILNNFGSSTLAWTSGNFDGATTIDLTDLSDVLNNFGATNPTPTVTPTPEPTALALLLPAALLLHNRQKRKA